MGNTSKKYVALLRGINVGGNRKVSMSELKKMFEKLGFQSVITYINSGNILFIDERDPAQIQSIITKSLESTFFLSIPVHIITFEALKNILSVVPDLWTNDKEQKTDVIFLNDKVDSKDILNKIVINAEIENVIYQKGALIWNIDRAHAKQGNSVQLVSSKLYKDMTIRNINTVRKLYSLLEERPVAS